MRLTTGSLLASVSLVVAAPSFAQEGDEERERLGIEDMLPGGDGPSPQDEMVALFQKVERRLADMGGYLLSAGAGDTSKLASVDASGIEELLRQARPNDPQPTGGIADLLSASKAEGERVLEDIDRILELAAQNGGT